MYFVEFRKVSAFKKKEKKWLTCRKQYGKKSTT